MEKLINSQKIFSGKVIDVYHDEVLMQDGKHAYREIVKHPGGVCILAIKNNEILFVEQFRYAYNKVILELPAGKLEANEDPLESAKRELREETGAISHELQFLGEMYPSPGYTNEIIRLYFTEDFIMTKAAPDEDEFLELRKIRLDKALEMIETGLIKDSKTIITLYKYLNFKQINK